MESDLLAVLHDVTSTQELDQRRGHLTKSFGVALTQLVPRRQEVQANPSSAISPPTPVQAPRTPEPEPVVEQKPDADAASATKGWTDRSSLRGISRRYHSSYMVNVPPAQEKMQG